METRNYQALKTIATINKALAALAGAVGMIGSFGVMATESVMMGIGGIFITGFYVLMMWAASEIIMVFVNLGEDTFITRKIASDINLKVQNLNARDAQRQQHAG